MSQNDLTHRNDVVRPERKPDLTVSVGQFTSVPEVRRNLHEIDMLTAQAAERGSDLIVFPEASMHEWNAAPDVIARAAADFGHQFTTDVRSIAAHHGVAIVAGSYVSTVEGQKPYNRLTAVGKDGAILATYDKVHLYDAFSYLESDTVAPGPIEGEFAELGVFELEGWRIGMLNCYDVRFPEISRGLIDRGADVLTLSSAWVVGPRKEFHLSTLAAARAIENTAFVAVSNQGGEHSTGLSTLLSPFGSALSTVDLEQGLATATFARALLEACREQLPVLRNRRYATNGTAALPGPYSVQHR